MTTFSLLFRQTAGFESSPNNAMVTAPMMPNLQPQSTAPASEAAKSFIEQTSQISLARAQNVRALNQNKNTAPFLNDAEPSGIRQ